MSPQMRPTMAASGMEVAGWPSDTPPTNTTASIPVRTTDESEFVTNKAGLSLCRYAYPHVKL